MIPSASLVDDAVRIGDHVVIEHDGELRRTISIGVPRTQSRFTMKRPDTGDLANDRRTKVRAAPPGCARIVDKGGRFLVIRAPTGVSLHDVEERSRDERAVLDFETAVALLEHPTRAIAALIGAGHAAPQLSRDTVRVGWNGELCFLGHLPCWPHPEREIDTTWRQWCTLARTLAERARTTPAETLFGSLVSWIGFVSRTTRGVVVEEHWRDATERLGEASALLGEPVDATRLRGLVRGLFPDEARAADALDEEPAMITDADLRRVKESTAT